MGNEVWYKRPFSLLRCYIGNLGWSLFCWANDYKGFVCDFATSEPLPCELWWQEQDAKKEPTDG